jgi:predicted phosphodiesterase
LLLWIISDLHLEATRGWDLPPLGNRPNFDVLVVAGDLIPQADRGVRWLLARVPDRHVIYVCGNHEAYGQDLDRTVEKARLAAVGTKLHVLQNDTAQIGDTIFIGATFWTDFNLFGNPSRAMMAAAEGMNDYKKIRVGNYFYRLRPSHTLQRHQQSREFIANELKKPKTGHRVVVSHMAPHPSAILSAFKDEVISACYASDASDLLALGGIDAWIFGHTHDTRDSMVEGTRLITNAKGYGPWFPKERTWENRNFDPGFVVEI